MALVLSSCFIATLIVAKFKFVAIKKHEKSTLMAQALLLLLWLVQSEMRQGFLCLGGNFHFLPFFMEGVGVADRNDSI